MSSAQKTIELQRQVQQNASEYRNQINDLYNWEKDIKLKEKEFQSTATAPKSRIDEAPVRSQVSKQSSGKTEEENKKLIYSSQNIPADSAASTPTEKQDLHADLVAQQHKKANDIKDRGNNYVKVADYDRAIMAYTEAIAVFSYDPIYYINRALCYLKQEDHDQCIEDCEAAITLDKLCVKAYYRRMQANESLGNNMEALKDCTTVLAIEPKNAEAKKSLQRINDRLRTIAASKTGPNFSQRNDLVNILPIDKPVYKRSKQPLRRVPIADIVSPRATKDEPGQLRISDEDIDKIFSSYSGQFEELKKENVQKSTAKITVTKTETATTLANKKVNDKLQVKKEYQKPIPELINSPKKMENPATKIIESKSLKNETKADLKQRTLPPAPTGTAQFYINWKELSAYQKYQYLKSIEINKLCKILGAGFDSDTFTDIIRTVHDFYLPNKEPTAAQILVEISKNDQFIILSMLMSSVEKKMIMSILETLKSSPDVILLTTLTKAYNLV